MEKEYLIMDDTENTFGACVSPEIDEESEKIISDIIKKYNLEEDN